MKKNWKRIVALSSLTIIMVVCFILFSEPKLSQSQMDMIDDEFTAKWAMWRDQKILWDRNVDGAKTYACQYVGIYGDCVAFLQYTHNTIGATWEPIPLPWYIEYSFFEREVWLHNNAYLLLYNLKEQKFRTTDILVDRDIQWLTEEQKEQLAQDIEEIGRKFGQGT